MLDMADRKMQQRMGYPQQKRTVLDHHYSTTIKTPHPAAINTLTHPTKPTPVKTLTPALLNPPPEAGPDSPPPPPPIPAPPELDPPVELGEADPLPEFNSESEP